MFLAEVPSLPASGPEYALHGFTPDTKDET